MQTSFAVRLNRHDNQGQVNEVKGGEWFYHNSYPNVDVAVRPYAIPTWADVTASPTQHIASDFKRESKDIGVGDLAYIVGVFQHLPGKDKNKPIVHTGHVASMVPNSRLGGLALNKLELRLPQRLRLGQCCGLALLIQ